MRLKLYILLFIFSANYANAQVTRNYTVILRGNNSPTSQIYITLWDGKQLPIWGFSHSLSAPVIIPGKTLYCNEGDTVIINARSVAQGQHHSIHLHGLDVDTRNDGDPMTSFVLNHMQDTTYTFVAHHAGTYLYHCHVAAVLHIQMGMYGMIVVKAKNGVNTAWTGGPAYDKDYKWLMSEVDKSWHDTIPPHDSAGHISSVPDFKPDYFWVNGKSKQQIKADDSTHVKGAVGQKIYMRLTGMGFYYYRVIFPASLDAVKIDSDGRPLPGSVNNDTIEFYPGERYGVMLTPSMQITDSAKVEYVNMNTHLTEGVEYVPITINGFVGLNNKEVMSDYTLYPNPANDNITLYSLKNEIDNFEIYNELGQLINNYNVNKTNNNVVLINTNNLNSGIYFIKIYSKQTVKTLKFTVNK